MRGQSDKVVAIIVTRLDSLSENLAVQTMLPAFYEQGYDPIMMESQFSPALVEEHLGMLARRNIDGVVLFGFTGIDEEMLAPGATRWCCWPATPPASPPSAMTTRARSRC
jgi:LacI family trehalose operon transcriptional repressor